MSFGNYCKAFFSEKDGFEFLQLAIVILIVAALATLVWKIASAIMDKLNEAKDQIDQIGTPEGFIQAIRLKIPWK